jgi:hypothetical protein
MLLLLILFIFMFGMLFLQFLLSRKEKWWLGLILPTLWFSVILFLALSEFGNPNVSMETKDGVVTVFSAGILGSIVKFTSFSNIPTFAMLVIYFVCRINQKKTKASEKISIQGL